MKKNKGFTLIELLVVIAIIGLLSTIVLVSLNSARNKAKDARIKADLAQVANVAEIIYADKGSYSGLESDQSFTHLKDDVVAQNIAGSVLTLVPSSPTTAYAAYALLSNGKYQCVDSNGMNKEVTSTSTLPTATDPTCH